MLCEYCHLPIPKDMLYCPHCGAANPYYEEKNNESKKKVTNINNNITINNVTVNSARNSSKKTQPQNQKTQASTNETSEEIKQSAICTVVTAIATAVAYTSGLNHEVSFFFIFTLFYIVEFIGNLFLFTVANAFRIPKFISILLCVVFMIIGCVSCSKHTESINESYSKTHDFSDFSSKSHSSSENRSKSHYSAKDTKTTVKYETLPDRPQDGMTFAQLKKQKWGYKFLYTKCRDFDSLRPNCRYYEVVWYNSNLERIGDGILCCQDEDDDTAILAGFRDYTE